MGYVVTARNPVPRISLFLLDPKGSLRFAPGFHPTSNPFCALRAGDFHSNFFGFWPPRGKACYYFIYQRAALQGGPKPGPEQRVVPRAPLTSAWGAPGPWGVVVFGAGALRFRGGGAKRGQAIPPPSKPNDELAL